VWGLNSNGLGRVSVAGSCEHGVGTSGSMKAEIP
jgi:hypothetical protein